MQHWQRLLENSIISPNELAGVLPVDSRGIEHVSQVYPMRINPYYLDLIRKHGAPLMKQAVPDPLELLDHVCMEDPLNEEHLSPVSNIVHKYPDRVLFLVASSCAMYCRFCTRKRKVGTNRMRITDAEIRQGIEYIRQNPKIRDVLLSGGDPLLMEDDRLEWVLASLRSIPSVEVIRIGSRVPCTLPMRISIKLARMMKKYHPLYINTHFNHPLEITGEAATACRKLADAGIPLGNQAVLLREVNDDAVTLKNLFSGLVKIRVKPYYLFQGDLTRGTNHFRVPIQKGMAIMRDLSGNLPLYALPTFSLDLPEGGGKVPLAPDFPGERGLLDFFHRTPADCCTYPAALL